MNPTPTPLEEIVKTFLEKFPQSDFSQIVVRPYQPCSDKDFETAKALTMHYQALPKRLEAFLRSSLAAAYNAGIGAAKYVLEHPSDAYCETLSDYSDEIIAALDKLLLPTDKPI